MPRTATPAADAGASSLATLSQAMIVCRARAKRSPGTVTGREPAGYQRSIAWAVRDSGEYLVLHRELLAPYDADREAVEMALPPGLVVLDERPMELRDGETGGTTCYRIGPRPEPAPEEACA